MLSKLAEELARFLSPRFSCDGGHFAPQRLPAYCGVRCAQPTAGRCHRALRACRCPPSGNSAAATSGRVRFDSPKAATRATRPQPTPHSVYSPVLSRPSFHPVLRPSHSNLSLLHRTSNAPNLHLPSPITTYPDASALLQQANALSQLAHYIIQVHHKTPHQPKRGTNPPGHQPTTAHCSKVLAVDDSPAPGKHDTSWRRLSQTGKQLHLDFGGRQANCSSPLLSSCSPLRTSRP